MILNYLTNWTVTPLTLNSSTFLDSHNWIKWGSIASSYALTDSGYFYNKSTALTWLKKGYPVVLHISKGHFVVAVGYEDNTFVILDPSSSSSTPVKWTSSYSGYSIDKYLVLYK